MKDLFQNLSQSSTQDEVIDSTLAGAPFGYEPSHVVRGTPLHTLDKRTILNILTETRWEDPSPPTKDTLSLHLSRAPTRSARRKRGRLSKGTTRAPAEQHPPRARPSARPDGRALRKPLGFEVLGGPGAPNASDGLRTPLANRTRQPAASFGLLVAMIRGQKPGLCIGRGRKSALCIGFRREPGPFPPRREAHARPLSQKASSRTRLRFEAPQGGFRTYTQSRFLAGTYTQSPILSTDQGCEGPADFVHGPWLRGARRRTFLPLTRETQKGRTRRYSPERLKN